MKHALIITTIGGFVPQFEMNDVRILQEKGYIVHYASDFDNPIYSINQEELKEAGIILHQIRIRKSPAHLTKNIQAFFQLRKIIKEENIQVIHCHNPMGGVVGRLAAAWNSGKPYVIYTAHGFHFYKGAPLQNWILYYTAERLLARCTNCLITINQEDFERARKFRLRKNGRVEHIPGVGVDIIKFQERPMLRERKRQELGIPENAFHVLSVGELNSNKNHEIMIKALYSIQDTDIYYSVCGKGNQLDYLQKLIAQLQLEERVHLLGYRTDIPEILQSADCFVFPSRREGLGIAAVEAMACAVPVIAADNRGTREYMQHNRNGLVCNANEPEAYKQALLHLKNSPEIRQQMAIHCRDMAKNFSIEATDRIMRQIYTEISVK